MVHADEAVSSWNAIVRWLERNAPASAQALNPAAGDDDIQRLCDTLGFRIPMELESWLRVNNGSTAKDVRTEIPGGFRLLPHPDSGLFPGGEVFLDCASIAVRYRNHLRIAADIGDEDWWRSSWIPVLAEADAHYGLLLDTGGADADAGTGADVPVLAFREADYAKRYAPSLGAVLAAVADALEHGRGGPLTRGRRPSVQDGCVVWE